MRSRSNNIDLLKDICFKDTVSTHSRLKAAAPKQAISMC